MRHVDPEILALLALGEPAAGAADDEHLTLCTQCQAELNNLSHAAAVGRSTLGASQLLTPDARVWDRVSSELGLAQPRPVVALRPRRWMPAIIAAVVASALVVGGAVAWRSLQPPETRVLASATLTAFPDWPDALGDAVVSTDSGGGRVLTVTLRAVEPDTGFHEVWLISSDATKLVSLGILSGTTATFTVPSGIDLSEFDLVDISSEAFDGDPTHSGDSIVRGQLT